VREPDSQHPGRHRPGQHHHGPTSTHAPLPAHPGFPCSIAATMNVPAMMYPTPSNE
jgi:hypothetical protein